jgi:glucuronate isomerase
MPRLHADRLFPADPATRQIARTLYNQVKGLPIYSPHGHTDPSWFALDEAFTDPATLLLRPDHYIFRMLYSQGIGLDQFGVGAERVPDPRAAWKIFAQNYFLFRGTPTRIWLDYCFEFVFGIEEEFSAATADLFFDRISEQLAKPEFRPRALFDRFKLAVLATTDAATDLLPWHKKIQESGWKGRVVPTFRPDAVVDPNAPNFAADVKLLGEQTNEDIAHWPGYLAALRQARARFKAAGCTATDHGHLTAQTADLSLAEAEALYYRVVAGDTTPAERELFRAQMLTEMAGMSLEDGLIMQIHPGSFRNHNPALFKKYGPDKGADIPTATDYVHALKPLLDKYGNEANLTILLFTLDETSYSRELAPLAGHYPALRLGPSWWFHDSPEGMMRFREQVTETAGFYNTAGFNDDTRAFLSIPARHDVARRVDCAFLARLVAEHRLPEAEAAELIVDLTVNLVKKTYRL